ncbi:MAG: glutamate synthase domain-containing protein 2 [Oleiphilaceae bacterium]|jgi:glutamate synthase domain-containing protein 2
MPLRDAIVFVSDCLVGFGLKKVRIIASDKIFSGFHMVKNLALGTDFCNSARDMMQTLGCVQSLECNTNQCPVGVATQNPTLAKGIVVTDKSECVARFQKETDRAARDLITSAVMDRPSQLNRTHILRRVSQIEMIQ